MTKQVDYKRMIEEIFTLNKGIRYSGVFYNGFTLIKMREGIQNLLTSEETAFSLTDTLSRWKTRQSLSNKLGKPLYAMAEYEKIKRITIPLNENGILLISTVCPR